MRVHAKAALAAMLLALGERLRSDMQHHAACAEHALPRRVWLPPPPATAGTPPLSLPPAMPPQLRRSCTVDSLGRSPSL